MTSHLNTGDEYLRAATDKVRNSFEAVSESFRLVGVDMFQAVNEIAYEIGGEELADKVVDTAFEDYDILPNPAAFKLLIAHNPDAAEKVMARTSEIQKERHQEEFDAKFPARSRLRKFGKALLDANTLLWTGQLPR